MISILLGGLYIKKFLSLSLSKDKLTIYHMNGISLGAKQLEDYVDFKVKLFLLSSLWHFDFR